MRLMPARSAVPDLRPSQPTNRAAVSVFPDASVTLIPFSGQRLGGHGFRCVKGDTVAFLHRFHEGGAEVAVFDHVAHRAFFDLCVIKV